MPRPSSNIRKLASRAIELGAVEAKVVNVNSIVVRDWVRLKCQFGCGGYGKCLTCPPYSPTPEQTRRILSEYSKAILMRFEPRGRDSHNVIAKLEREAFLMGYYSVFGLVAGPCSFCEKCNLKHCVHPHLARPSMEACGIDVYTTVRSNDFKLEVVKSKKDKPRYFGLLLVH